MRRAVVAMGLVAVCSGVMLPVAVLPAHAAPPPQRNRPVVSAAAATIPASTRGPQHRVPPRIVLYGDSLVSEAGQDFIALATRAGASVQVHTYPGTSPCDYFSNMADVAESWHPTVAELVFTGDSFTACMGGVQIGTPQYFAKYRAQTRAAIAIFRAVGARVVLGAQPAGATARLTKNGAALNRLYRSIAAKSPGVTYADPGQAVLAKGRFTWTLPCLSGEPCTGPNGTNVVRAPDGVHFCPNGKTAPAGGGFWQCDVYASGAYRFASAMLAAALARPTRGPAFALGTPPRPAATTN